MEFRLILENRPRQSILEPQPVNSQTEDLHLPLGPSLHFQHKPQTLHAASIQCPAGLVVARMAGERISIDKLLIRDNTSTMVTSDQLTIVSLFSIADCHTIHL